jgi:hypothetical protein
MKAMGLILAVFFVLASVGGAVAQTAPSTSQPAPQSSAPSSNAPAPKADVDVKADVRTNDKGADIKTRIDPSPSVSNDRDRADGSAFPRTAAPQRTTLFGLSPAAAIVIASALLVVVILAIVAMARSGDRATYVERDRRM